MKNELEQDNDTWQPISLAAGRLLLELTKEHQPDSERDTPEHDEQTKKNEERERYITQRIAEIERFERGYTRKRT